MRSQEDMLRELERIADFFERELQLANPDRQRHIELLHGRSTEAAIVIGAVSVTLSLAGLELGDRLGTQLGERGELLGGLVLIAVGVAIASGIL